MSPLRVLAGGNWETVSTPHFKLAGVWKQADAVFAKAPLPHRYAPTLRPADLLTSPNWWRSYSSYLVYSQQSGTPTVEGGNSIRLPDWVIASGYSNAAWAWSAYFVTGHTYDVSITATFPAGVSWSARTVNSTVGVGNTVVGSGTSSFSFTHAVTSGAILIGISVGLDANNTAGPLITAVTLTDRTPDTVEANDGTWHGWKQIWPNSATGTPKIVGVTKAARHVMSFTDPVKGGHAMSGRFYTPAVPYYRVIGDATQIASAKVTLTFTPVAPKSPVEHTISWEAPVGWGIYHVAYMGLGGNPKYYFAAMTDAEVTALKSAGTRYVTQMWTPREGGHFAYMPVCWDASGVTVPMTTESETATSEQTGTDPYSGYTPFPPNRTATSALADYTVSNGYSDMASTSVIYTAVTIELKNSGGTVLSSWTGSLPGGVYVDEPGKKDAVTPALRMARSESGIVPDFNLYWPSEWRGLFDRFPYETQRDLEIRFSRDTHKGEAEWTVHDLDGERIGDFRLAMRKGVPDTVEIHGVNLAPDLVGMGIMKTIVWYGTIWSPARFVVLEPPNRETYDVMRSWGWTKLEDAPNKSRFYDFYKTYDPRATDKYLIYDTHVPMYNRFSELDFPDPEEVAQW